MSGPARKAPAHPFRRPAMFSAFPRCEPRYHRSGAQVPGRAAAAGHCDRCGVALLPAGAGSGPDHGRNPAGARHARAGGAPCPANRRSCAADTSFPDARGDRAWSLQCPPRRRSRQRSASPIHKAGAVSPNQSRLPSRSQTIPPPLAVRPRMGTDGGLSPSNQIGKPRRTEFLAAHGPAFFPVLPVSRPALPACVRR